LQAGSKRVTNGADVKQQQISLYHTDLWFKTVSKYIPPNQHRIGKNKTWKIERKNLNFMTHIPKIDGVKIRSKIPKLELKIDGVEP